MNSQQNLDLAVHTSAMPTEGLQGESDKTLERNVIVTALSKEAQLKLEVIKSLLEPCDRTTYGQKLKETAEKLGVSVRTVQRLVKKWEQDCKKLLTAMLLSQPRKAVRSVKNWNRRFCDLLGLMKVQWLLTIFIFGISCQCVSPIVVENARSHSKITPTVDVMSAPYL